MVTQKKMIFTTSQVAKWQRIDRAVMLAPLMVWDDFLVYAVVLEENSAIVKEMAALKNVTVAPWTQLEPDLFMSGAFNSGISDKIRYNGI